jgi:hypothetical protein
MHAAPGWAWSLICHRLERIVAKSTYLSISAAERRSCAGSIWSASRRPELPRALDLRRSGAGYGPVQRRKPWPRTVAIQRGDRATSPSLRRRSAT